ncbi:MAG: redox-sensitive transcriptional activator SoxR [Bacteriovoracaceae bacterium]|nr:redox-sensitive transcriptional activator SoxR [Bacteriovoracaceae bacterium]
MSNEQFYSKLKAILSVGELSKRSGLPISTIHFYEEKGIISSFRNNGNQRQFPRESLRIVSLVKAAQGIGYSLEEIKSMLDNLPKDRKLTDADWTRISKVWRNEIESKIKALMQIRDHLDKCIGCGCLSLTECPLRNPEDKLCKKGSGPQLILKK